jgi:hypothetical protein
MRNIRPLRIPVTRDHFDKYQEIPNWMTSRCSFVAILFHDVNALNALIIPLFFSWACQNVFTAAIRIIQAKTGSPSTAVLGSMHNSGWNFRHYLTTGF